MQSPPPEEAHVESALAAAECFLTERSLQLTPIRRAVLCLLYRAGKAVGAYDLIYQHEQIVRHRVAPNTIYRALAFLEKHRLVARLAGQRRYVAIAPRTDRFALFLTCTRCGATAELAAASVESALGDAAGALGFRAAQRPIEVEGLCERCRAAPETM